MSANPGNKLRNCQIIFIKYLIFNIFKIVQIFSNGQTTTAFNGNQCCKKRTVSGKGGGIDGIYLLQDNLPATKPHESCADNCLYSKLDEPGENFCFQEVDLADAANVVCEAISSTELTTITSLLSTVTSMLSSSTQPQPSPTQPQSTPTLQASTTQPQSTPTEQASTTQPQSTPTIQASSTQPQSSQSHQASTSQPQSTPTEQASTTQSQSTTLPQSSTQPQSTASQQASTTTLQSATSQSTPHSVNPSTVLPTTLSSIGQSSTSTFPSSTSLGK